jgi:hypothetical protein
MGETICCLFLLISHRQVVTKDYDLGNTRCLYSKDVACDPQIKPNVNINSLFCYYSFQKQPERNKLRVLLVSNINDTAHH